MEPPVDQKLLEDFLSLCRHRSFSHAAQERNVTQPAFSRSIQGLEQEFGCVLVDRANKDLRPTPEGQVVLQHALRLVQGAAQRSSSSGVRRTALAALPAAGYTVSKRRSDSSRNTSTPSLSANGHTPPTPWPISGLSFGALAREGDAVRGFIEKPRGDGGWINGGFFVLSPKVIDYISADSTSWELEPMTRLASGNQLKAFEHHGFWQPMDTLREKILLEELWQNNEAPWKVWT